MDPVKVQPDRLHGVPETMLLTLYNRAVESRRPDAILHDAQAVALVEQLDDDFRRFGTGHVAHAIRASRCMCLGTAAVWMMPPLAPMDAGC